MFGAYEVFNNMAFTTLLHIILPWRVEETQLLISSREY